MNNNDHTKQLFIHYCGEKYEMFMEKLYINAQGEIELKFWQDKLVQTFLDEHEHLSLTHEALLEILRDGCKIAYTCPLPD